MALNFANDNVWINKKQYDAAEAQYYECLTKELINKKKDINCNGDAHEFSKNSLNENSLSNGKPKKSTKNKNKVNTSSATNSNCVEEATATVQQVKSNAKKNKKKKSQTHKDDVDASAHCNNVSIRKQPNMPSNESKRGTSSNNHGTLVSEIAKAREHIKNSLEKMEGMASSIGGPDESSKLLERISTVEKENADLKRLVENLKNLVLDSQKRIAALEGQNAGGKQPAKVVAANKKSEADDDDGVDLFASDSDEESAEAARVREERLAAYAAKKSKKPALIAKSSLILDVKPWDDETDLKEMEKEIRSITADGLLWGASKFVPVAFGIQKLSISCVVEDEKVSIDWLTEEIEKFEDFVQSVDVAAFNKI